MMPQSSRPIPAALLSALVALAIAPAVSGAISTPHGGQGLEPQVKIVTPRSDQPLPDPVIIQALVRGAAIERVVAYLDGRRLGALTEPPYRWVVPRPGSGPTVNVRVVAVDRNGLEGSAEHLVSRVLGARFHAQVDVVRFNLAARDVLQRFVDDLSVDDLVVRDNGREQQILELARAEAPLRIAILLDRSGSMASKMDGTRRALVGFLAQLGPQDQVKLIGFNHQITAFTPFTNMHDLVGSFAQVISAEDGTALYDAVLYAYQQFEPSEEARERHVILLLTDGEDQGSRTPLYRALGRVRTAGVTIFALGQGGALSDDALKEVIVEMVDLTGGEAYFENDPDRLEGVFVEIAKAMRALYLVAYRPTDVSPGWHQLEVESVRSGVRLRHKPGYMKVTQ